MRATAAHRAVRGGTTHRQWPVRITELTQIALYLIIIVIRDILQFYICVEYEIFFIIH